MPRSVLVCAYSLVLYHILVRLASRTHEMSFFLREMQTARSAGGMFARFAAKFVLILR